VGRRKRGGCERPPRYKKFSKKKRSTAGTVLRNLATIRTASEGRGLRKDEIAKKEVKVEQRKRRSQGGQNKNWRDDRQNRQESEPPSPEASLMAMT